jgi:peptidyl-prolyl cis-trans isomerase D
MEGLAQTREFSLLQFRPAEYAARLEPTEEQLVQFHRDEAQRFTIPQSAKVAWVVLSAENLGRQIKISEGDVRAYYEQNRSRLGRPERRRASHILVQVLAQASEADAEKARVKAQALLAQVRDVSAERFAAFARAQSDDAGSKAGGGDLDWFTHDSMVKPFADATFAATGIGLVDEVIRSEFGFHIIRVTGIEPAQTKPFAEVRDQLESELKKQQAGKKYAESAESFSNLVYEQSDSLEAAANRFGLTVQTLEGVTPEGPSKTSVSASNKASNNASDKEVVAGDLAPLSNRRLLTTLFSEDSIRSRRNSEAIETASGTLVSARLVDHQPAQLRPLETVRTEVKSLWIQTQSLQLAAKAGATQLKQFQDGSKPEGSFVKAGKISRMDRGDLPPAVVNAVLSASVSKLPAYVGVDLGAQGYVIARVDAIQPGDPGPAKANEAQLESQIRRTEGEQSVASWLKAWQASLGVQRSAR